MHNILQISDIHFNGEYDGQFDVKCHFEQILNATKDQEFAAVALTGDLADNGSIDDYVDMLNRIIATYGVETPLLVIPGNHDNRENLAIAYGRYLRMEHQFKDGATLESIGGTFKEPGACAIIISIPDKSAGRTYYMVGMDNAHKDLPHAGLDTLYSRVWKDTSTFNVAHLFVHMPLIRPFHRFMNGSAFSIPYDASRTFLYAAGRVLNGYRIYCGHYHCASVERLGDFVQYVAPASQCQLDPFSDTCVPSGNFPGYSVISLETARAEFKYILGDGDAK
jgi:DNA repair exonuclease SbcCD nuclease subunit